MAGAACGLFALDGAEGLRRWRCFSFWSCCARFVAFFFSRYAGSVRGFFGEFGGVPAAGFAFADRNWSSFYRAPNFTLRSLMILVRTASSRGLPFSASFCAVGSRSAAAMMSFRRAVTWAAMASRFPAAWARLRWSRMVVSAFLCCCWAWRVQQDFRGVDFGFAGGGAGFADLLFGGGFGVGDARVGPLCWGPHISHSRGVTASAGAAEAPLTTIPCG